MWMGMTPEELKTLARAETYKELWEIERKRREELEAMLRNQGAFMERIKEQTITYKEQLDIALRRLNLMEIHRDFLRAQVPNKSGDSE